LAASASGFANDLPHPLLAGVLVDQCHCGTKFDGVAGKFRHIDYFGTRKLIFELGNASLIDLVFCVGGLVF